MKPILAHALLILLLPVRLAILAYWLAGEWLAGREVGGMRAE